MTATQSPPLPLAALADAIAHWREHGWARLGRVATDADLEALRRRADDVMQGRVVHEGLFFQHDAATGRYEDLEFGRGWVGPSDAYRKIEKLERDPVFLAWIENPVFEQVVRAVVGAEVAIYRATLFSKSARGGTELPWHQDGGSFWGLDRDPELQLWTALDDVPQDSGCVEVVDRSHRGGLATPLGGSIPRDVVERMLCPPGGRPASPDLRAGADARRLALPAAAGDVLLIHNHLWHRSGTNATGRPRRAFTVAYMPASTRCVRKRRAPRQFVRVFTSGRQAP
jgi:hypothetical protein